MNLKKIIKSGLLLACASACTLAFSNTAEEGIRVGVVDFRTCLEKSYVGQEEQLKLEAMRNEMVSTLEGKEKMLSEVMEKLKKRDYLDTISAQAEEELQGQYAHLSEEIQQLQNQAYQALNQAQMKMFQTVSEQVAKSAEYLARENNLDLVMNQESCFYFKRPLEITQLVVQELNRHFQPEIAAHKENETKTELE
ncbi:MAG: hypothetical protein S4CHLAM7_13700 [Chlamydiae bacterium]|nr:hypothetical protein [Chlamydiota bacterium]